MRRSVLSLLVLASLAIPLHGAGAQEPVRDSLDVGGFVPAADTTTERELVDRVVAVVGDTSVLLSEVQERILQLRQQGLQIPTDPVGRDSLFRGALEAVIQERMLLEAASEAGVTVPDAQVEQVVEDRFSRMRSNFSSDQEFRDAVESTGQNMFQFRQFLRANARADLTIQRFQQELMQRQNMPSANVTDAEVRAFFEQRAEGRERPGSITFERVMVIPTPDSARADSARRIAETALEEIRAGEEFAVVARRYSDDLGSRERGGDLGWIRRGDVVPTFARAAWTAPPGRAVGPVRSRFGYHVIQVENVRGGERKVRHLLVRPEIEQSDVEEARELAASLADSLRAGADADRLARSYGLPDEQVRYELRLDELQGRLGEAYVRALSDPEVGSVVGPFEVSGAFDLPGFVIAEVLEHTPTGEYRFEDVRDRIRQNLLQQKQFTKYLDELRNRMYVRVLL